MKASKIKWETYFSGREPLTVPWSSPTWDLWRKNIIKVYLNHIDFYSEGVNKELGKSKSNLKSWQEGEKVLDFFGEVKEKVKR